MPVICGVLWRFVLEMQPKNGDFFRAYVFIFADPQKITDGNRAQRVQI